MKNIKYILLFIIILSSCERFAENKFQNKFFTQDFKKFNTKNELEIIDLDSISNFSELREKMGNITCAGKASGLKFKYNRTLYHIVGFSRCPTSPVGCYFRRNLLFIRNDSLIVQYGENEIKKPIEYLKTELDSIISKPYNFQYKENKLKPALIHLFIENKYPISTTKKVLKEIAEQFNRIDSVNNPDFFKYHILFESYDFTKIQVPPPPKLAGTEE